MSIPARRRLSVVPEPSARDLTSVLTDVARGDEAAFAELYDLTSALVYGIVRRVLRDPSMSEEVTQDVYVELWRTAPRFDASKGSAQAWTCSLAHRRAVDRVRSEQSRRDREERDGRRSLADFDETTETVIDRLDRSEVAAALDVLTPTQREAIRLAYYGGHTYAEVAVLLGVPEGTVKTRIRDGLIKLRDSMGVG